MDRRESVASLLHQHRQKEQKRIRMAADSTRHSITTPIAVGRQYSYQNPGLVKHHESIDPTDEFFRSTTWDPVAFSRSGDQYDPYGQTTVAISGGQVDPTCDAVLRKLPQMEGIPERRHGDDADWLEQLSEETSILVEQQSAARPALSQQSRQLPRPRRASKPPAPPPPSATNNSSSNETEL